MMVLIYIALLVIPLLFYISSRYKKFERFFQERGIKYMKPGIFSGDILPYTMFTKNFGDVIADFCNKHPEDPLLGHYDQTSPTLIVTNAEYIEKILIKDFSHFTDHGFDDFINKTRNPFDESLFTMNGAQWRAFRHKMSPLFTSGKLKSMFTSMKTSSDSLCEFLKQKPLKQYEINEATRLFSLDVIASSIFGLETNVMKHPDSEYCKVAKKAFNNGILDLLRFMFISFMPGFIVRLFGFSMNKQEVIDYFSKIVNETLDYRRKTNTQRNDVIQLLLQLKEKNRIEITSWDSNDDYLKSDEIAPITDSYEVNDQFITVQAFGFLIGGFDFLSLAIMYTCFELTQNPEIQERARTEILNQVKLHSGLTYEALKGMIYLENTVKETLRIHPLLPFVMRVCTKDYTFPNGYTIRKGEKIQIPTAVVHLNPNYFSEPKLFKPERFELPPKPGSFLTFGDGPRICLGMRYAILHIKMGLATILMHYKLKLDPKVKLPLKMKPTGLFMVPTQKLLFELEEIAK